MHLKWHSLGFRVGSISLAHKTITRDCSVTFISHWSTINVIIGKISYEPDCIQPKNRRRTVRVKEVESGFPKQIRTQPKSMSVLNWKPNLHLSFIFGKNKQSSSTRELSRSKCSWRLIDPEIEYLLPGIEIKNLFNTWKLSRLDECKIELIADTVCAEI